jgi:uncharacterized protein
MYLPSILAGIIIGFVLGFLGAGGTVVGLPIFLLFSNLHGHKVLGTNASGVALVAASIFIWRLYKKDVDVITGVIFSLPGLLGIYTGAQLGLLYPGKSLIFLLGIVIFFIAGWMFYQSVRKENTNKNTYIAKSGQTGNTMNSKRRLYLIPAAFAIGAVAGFFAIGGGFMIVPAFILIGEMAINDAAGTALLPITLFAALVGLEYFNAGDVNLTLAGIMIVPGIISGSFGIWLAKRLPKKIMQRLFSLFLILIGFFMIFR